MDSPAPTTVPASVPAAGPVGPGLYTEIGKKARDLLYKDYHTDQKFTLTTTAANGAAITVAGTKKNEVVFSEIQSQLKGKKYTVDVKATSDSKVITTVTINELYTPGLKGIISVPTPYQKSSTGKVELQYLHPHAGINASVGLNANPLVNFSGVFGTKAVALGVDAAFDTASGDFTKYNAGLSHTNQDLTTSLNLNNKGDTLAASYYHQVHGTTAVGAEIAHTFSSNENTLTIGSQHELDPLTTVKARFNNFGIASALLQHAWRPKSLVTFSTEIDTKAIEKSPKFGLALSLKP
ncbi:mitochondrial outer membrane protein porin 2 [Lolium perenne]|jgi:voltage-dependent anion channel protein 2|uniref:mitochondrial outer membrane protein porin 2 n=1 Tax=Lolium perenne TaxID=4522 RepID=UPI0021F53CCD|nr:mitochondrial outer membrane protein porin 2-like [Lolium perenne]